MNDIEILQEMLISAAQVPLRQNGEVTYSVKLADDEANTKVTIKGIPWDSIVIRADVFFPRAETKEFKDRFIFQGSKGENRRADFVIVSRGARKWVVCIEIKKPNRGRKEIVEQLEGALCFVSYCKSIGRAFWTKDDFLEDCDYRFVSMVNVSVNKKSTRPSNPKPLLHSRPNEFLKLFGRLHHFSRLTNGGS